MGGSTVGAPSGSGSELSSGTSNLATAGSGAADGLFKSFHYNGQLSRFL